MTGDTPGTPPDTVLEHDVDDRLVRAAVDAVAAPFLILQAVRDGAGAIVDLRFRYSNPALQELLHGVPGAAGPVPAAGRTALGIWPYLASADNYCQVIRVIETGEPWSFRFHTGMTGFAPEWLEGTACRLGDGAVLTLRDDTLAEGQRAALTRARIAYGALVDALPDRVVAVFDRDLRVTLIAGRALDRVETPARELIGRGIREVVVPEHVADVEAAARAALTGRHVVLPRLALRHTTYRVDAAPLTDPDGQVRSGMLVALDLGSADREQAERDRTLWELDQAQRLARTGSWRWDARTGLVWWSSQLRRLVGMPDRDPHSTLAEALAVLDRSPAAAADLRARWSRALVDHEPFEAEHAMEDVDGTAWHLVVRAVLDDAGELTGLRGTVQDVTERARAARALAESEERFRLAFEGPTAQALLAPTPDGREPGVHAARVLRANRALCQLLGREPEELVGTSLWDWVVPEDRDLARAALTGSATSADPGSGASAARVEVRLATRRPGPVWVGIRAATVRDDDGRMLHLLAQIDDVTARREAESELVRRARFDALTGLPSRSALVERLETVLASQAPPPAVYFLDLDDFTTVNDSLGHAAGDALLERVAAQLAGCLQGDDFAARWGGDEFVVLSPRTGRVAAARALADRLRAAVGEPVKIDGHEVTTTASIGVAICGQGSTAEGLLRDADIAMRQAKVAGKDRWALGDSAGHADALRRLTLGAALRRALEEDQLLLQYQPVVDLETATIVGVEALLRWRHPQQGLLHPADFLDVAEQSALIVPVGEWALRTACFQASAWRRSFGDRAPTVAVNVSARQLGHGRLHPRAARALADSGLEPSMLCLELTEREAVAASGAEALDLQQLHESGVRLAVDDFGTGYAGLNYLRRFPVDVLKIDQSFVHGLGTDPTDTAIIVSLITLGRALEVTVVAEGVEDDGQRTMLRRLGCPQGQGRLWSDPVDADRITEMLHAAGA